MNCGPKCRPGNCICPGRLLFTTDKFEAGETFWSPDLKTWYRGDPPPVIVRAGPSIEVTGVDRERGIITVGAK